MKSTGEVMGISKEFSIALSKAWLATGQKLPLYGRVFLSVKDDDKRDVIFLAKKLIDMGFVIYSTNGTRKVLERNGIPVRLAYRMNEGRPNAIDLILNSELELIINTPFGKEPRADEAKIRSLAISRGIPVITTMSVAQVFASAIETMRKSSLEVVSLQECHRTLSSYKKRHQQTVAR
jgi:carbamoyl-phosphate synthase large subunit